MQLPSNHLPCWVDPGRQSTSPHSRNEERQHLKLCNTNIPFYILGTPLPQGTEAEQLSYSLVPEAEAVGITRYMFSLKME
ncbi:Uncharacterized protein TCM_033815 [Theobroma cacao]|uniref:Uncharacterized protein n=1 Tax=Theobroma cacao TaxID=3641 RepID=A0A061FIV3_THECC|nr:Uncharacterized protein TCM_033815 [Theobroma cacao]